MRSIRAKFAKTALREGAAVDHAPGAKLMKPLTLAQAFGPKVRRTGFRLSMISKQSLSRKVRRLRSGLAAITLLFLNPLSGFPQSFGLKFAYPNADVFQASTLGSPPTYSFHARPMKFGLTGELPLPVGLLFEFDALYSQLSYASSNPGPNGLIRTATSVNCWDLPVLIKKDVLHKIVRPFVDGGAVFQVANADANMTTAAFPSRFRPPEFIHQVVAGIAGGIGIDLKAGRFHFEPEFRYMRLGGKNFQAPVGTFQSNVHQPVIVLGLQIGSGSNR